MSRSSAATVYTSPQITVLHAITKHDNRHHFGFLGLRSRWSSSLERPSNLYIPGY